MLKKSILVIASALLLFGFGVYLGGKDKYPLYATKSFFQIENNIQISGELKAIDYTPAITHRIIRLHCFKSPIKNCSMAEASVFMNTTGVELTTLDQTDIKSWDQEDNIIIEISGEKFVRTIDINMKKKTMIEIYKFQNGEIRTNKLMDSLEKLN